MTPPAVTVSVLALLLGFQGVAASAAPQDAVTTLTHRSETRLLAGDESHCRIEPYVGGESMAVALGMGLINAVLPGTLGRGIDALAGYLRTRAAATSSALETLGTGTYLYRNDGGKLVSDLKCIAVIRGDFGVANKAGSDERIPPEPSGRLKTADLLLLNLAAPPELYLELNVLYSADMRALQIVPTYLYFRKTTANAGGREPKDIEITLTFATPGTEAKSGTAGTTFGVVPIHIRKIPAGSEVDKSLLKGAASTWISLPAEPERKADDKEKGKDEIIASTRNRPVNVLATYRETDDPSAFFQFLADVLTDSKSGIIETTKLPTAQARE